jgi:hypothetical protein
LNASGIYNLGFAWKAYKHSMALKTIMNEYENEASLALLHYGIYFHGFLWFVTQYHAPWFFTFGMDF